MPEMNNAGGLAAEIKSHFDAVEKRFGPLPDKVSEALLRLNELEQKVASSESFRPETSLNGPTWGDQLIQHSEDLKAFGANRRGKSTVSFDVKTITSVSASGGALVPPRQDDAVGLARRRLTIRALLTQLPWTTGLVEYPKQTARTNNADVVEEGTLKPESDYGWEMESVPVRTIAHWTAASVQILDDAPQLKALVDDELQYGLALKEEVQLLTGSGSGQNLTGLITTAQAYSAVFTPDAETMIDRIGLALLQAALNDREPNGVVVHPSDWMRMRLLKNANGDYILGDPGANVTPMLFGKPVVETKAMSVDKFLVGDFRAAATIYDRMLPRIDISTEHADFFTRNMVAIRAEERVALAIKAEDALIYGDFGNVA